MKPLQFVSVVEWDSKTLKERISVIISSEKNGYDVSSMKGEIEPLIVDRQRLT